ncbi:flavodoxin [Sutterella sp.]|uniref:flavodoxin n=1 Tax=Sutterella sp. TaxID=1981025 RepID=UPI0026DEBB6C|nr:flavodoxin [Sutterella sp.]MDO5530805.1 flavodoxin [Sutterella sp.]
MTRITAFSSIILNSPMQRRSALLLAAAGALGLSARPAFSAPSAAGRILVVYFTMPETDKVGPMTGDEDNSCVVVDGKVLGNTQYVAQLIAERTKADIFRIEPAKPYPLNHRTLVDQAAEEQRANLRPALKSLPDLSKYDTVFFGSPIWWADYPMPVYTFLESVDLSGKRVIPFSTHGGSGFAGTIETLAELAPKAKVNRDGLTISRTRMETAPERVKEWLDRLGF